MPTPEPSPLPLRSQFASDPDMTELIELFLGELPARVDAILSAMRSGETGQLRRLTHQLRGAAAGYGYPTIGEVAGRIELGLQATQADAAAQSLTEIEQGVRELVTLCNRAVFPRE